MKSLVLCTLALVSVSAFANNKPLTSFDDLRTACKEPAKYQNQVAPSNIQISCTDQQSAWVATAAGSVAMDTTHYVTSAIASDKYTVNPTTQEVKSASQVSACGRLKEVNETVSVPKSLSCDEVLAFQGDATAYCLALVADVKANNPSAVQFADTGRTLDTCGVAVAVPAPAPAPAPAQQPKPASGWFW